MNSREGFSTQKSPETELDNETLQELESSVRSMVRGILTGAPEDTEKKKQLVIDQIAFFGKAVFAGREDLLENILKRIEVLQFDTDLQLEEGVAGEIGEAMAEYSAQNSIPLKELLADFRIKRIEQSGDIPLDKSGILYASRYKDSIELHINKGLTADVWKEAISVFVPIIQGDDNIKTIDMRSWVIAKKSDYFKGLGFSVNEIADEEVLAEIRAGYQGSLKEHLGDPISKASMTRDEFLGSKIVTRLSRK